MPMMVPLPKTLGGSGEFAGWTLQDARYAATWDSGIGAYTVGGRWSSPGRHVIYAAIDPSTAILEVAVHKGFKVLNTVPHHLHSFTIADPSLVHVVHPSDVPNANWLKPITPCEDQQAFGDALSARQPFFLIPSAVSEHSWNLIVNVATARRHMADAKASPLALDPRLRARFP